MAECVGSDAERAGHLLFGDCRVDREPAVAHAGQPGRVTDVSPDRAAGPTLPTWQAGEATRSLLAGFAASFPLRTPCPIATPEMADHLLARSEGTIGELAALLTAAATITEALEDGVVTGHGDAAHFLRAREGGGSLQTTSDRFAAGS